mmetsp:Transcript_28012/g.47086  ORF Transcript_28012/g.47086 Transcript_28012/m.47086 type:complete len:810 (-) Transcript_28012:345-2774(-)|eukprot:CAMPEP_0174989250 /NCGR_PEP_ID=MMETSP0004_2-20121128/20611_1 /TAXON_ID=420556 /ORGANISM="Ochromonas sp., Strain CCMP1393" /LENGTH=809 /DNA_ID=CAMNT_0016242625 /DNA_START=139 /DNA_END=2568 /DNA_ORIENTATION=+
MSSLHSNSSGRPPSKGSGLSAEDMLVNNSFDQEANSHPHQDHHSDAIKNETVRNAECFYKLCVKQTNCGCLPCGKFKDRNNAILSLLFSLMIFFLMVSVIVPLILIEVAEYGINQQVVMSDSSNPNYDAWQNNVESPGKDHVVINYDLFFFDIQNPEDALNGAKPKLMQRGPYSYREYYVKFDIEWSDGGDTVTYNTQKYYLWNAERSGAGLTQEDELMLPYPTVIGFEYLLGQVPVSAEEMIDYTIDGALKEQEIKLESQLTQLYSKIDDHRIPKNIKERLEERLVSANNSIGAFFDNIYSFVDEAHAGQLLLKTLMCRVDSGISPFWKVKPFEAWFGWLNDPLLLEVQGILDLVIAKSPNITSIPWTNAVPGASTNWSSVEETRRRRAPDTYKTGLRNKNQIGQYVRYNNMSTLYVCVAPTDSQNMSAYDDTKQYPACEHFQYEWDAETIEAKGYVKPFATDYANRIAGTDANSFGRPVTTERLQVFISDIYRSCFLKYSEDVMWNNVKLRRYDIQPKDMLNATLNEENEQYYNFAPSGMENTTLAVGLPVFVSYPHFLYGDEQLAAAVEGLSPSPAEHDSYLDIEPQTGLLAGVAKKLQVNYEMWDESYPTTQPDTIDKANAVCADLDEALAILHALNIDTGNITTLSCNLTIFTEMFTCFNAPADWQMHNGDIFFPYGWTNENFYLPDDDAEDMQNSLFVIDTVADEVRFWSLICACCCATALMAMMYRGYIDKHHSVFDPITMIKEMQQEREKNIRRASFEEHHRRSAGSISESINKELYGDNVMEESKAHDLLLESATEPLLR